MEKIKISQYVSALRLKEGLSIRDFAKLHGISHMVAFRYEKGEFDNPTYNMARKFCRTFNVSKNVFAADFLYKDERIKFNFINEENLKSRVIDYWKEDSGNKVIEKFFNRVKEKTGLHDLTVIPINKVEQNKYNIWHEATCYTKNGELVWIGPILFLLGECAPFLKQDFSSISSPIHSICLLDCDKLPDRCKNYVFFIPSKACFNYLRDFGYDQKTSKNNVIIYFVDHKIIKDKAVLFGKDFLEEK